MDKGVVALPFIRLVSVFETTLSSKNGLKS